jgi:hypothetical protein
LINEHRAGDKRPLHFRTSNVCKLLLLDLLKMQTLNYGKLSHGFYKHKIKSQINSVFPYGMLNDEVPHAPPTKPLPQGLGGAPQRLLNLLKRV